MKKLTIILIIVAVLCCSFAFVGCKDGDDGETFVGAISKTTYESKEDAVKGFLQEEISGDAFMAEYVGYTKTSELSQKEIKELAIADEDREGIESVEKGEVEYIEQISVQEEKLTQLASETCKREMYIVVYKLNDKEMYRFYVPDNVIGETLSASYINSVFDIKKYTNCTCYGNLTIGGEQQPDSVYNRIIKVDGKNFYQIEYINIDDLEYCQELYIIYNNNNNFFVAKDDEEFIVYESTGENYEVSANFVYYLREIIETLYDPSGNKPLDHSRYYKTATGFSTKFDAYGGTYEISINVSKDRITNIIIEGSNFEYAQVKYTYVLSDFGKTMIDIPRDAIKAIEEGINN